MDPDIVRDIIIGLADGLTVPFGLTVSPGDLLNLGASTSRADFFSLNHSYPHFIYTLSSTIVLGWTVIARIFAPGLRRRSRRARLRRSVHGRGRIPLGAGGA